MPVEDVDIKRAREAIRSVYYNWPKRIVTAVSQAISEARAAERKAVLEEVVKGQLAEAVTTIARQAEQIAAYREALECYTESGDGEEDRGHVARAALRETRHGK